MLDVLGAPQNIPNLVLAKDFRQRVRLHWIRQNLVEGPLLLEGYLVGEPECRNRDLDRIRR
jgi:hypothetical protein